MNIDLTHPVVIFCLLILLAVVAVAILPSPVGWVFGAICLLGCLAVVVSAGPRGPRTPRT